jgi:CRISPR-associated protein Cas1
MKHSIEIVSDGISLSKDRGFLIVQQNGQSNSIPLHMIESISVSSWQGSITFNAINALIDHGALISFPNKRQEPVALLVACSSITSCAEKRQHQFRCGDRQKGIIWKELIAAKIINQSSFLKTRDSITATKICGLVGKVNQGDKHNIEGVAARYYWKANNITRGDQSKPINHCLDYAYTILRNAFIRAIVSQGLLPELSVFHSNLKNPYALADDLMEPFRPLADYVVLGLQDYVLTPEVKKKLVGVGEIEIMVGENIYKLVTIIPLVVNEYYRAICGPIENLRKTNVYTLAQQV